MDLFYGKLPCKSTASSLFYVGFYEGLLNFALFLR